jgi:hypothetical protein
MAPFERTTASSRPLLSPMSAFCLPPRLHLRTLRALLLVALTLPMPAADVLTVRPGDDLPQALATARSQNIKRVVFADGDYYDTQLRLTAEDSGLTLEAAPGARAVLHGGVPLTGWREEPDGTLSASLPASRVWDVRLLIVNGAMRPRARWPEEGTLTYLNTFEPRWRSTAEGGWQRPPTDDELTQLRVRPEDLPASLDPRNAEITIYHMWDESVVGVKSVDLDPAVLRLSPAPGHPPGGFGVQKYVVWNTREGLTRPGQWYFDRTHQRIVYRPLPGERFDRLSAVVPTQQTILQLAGTAEQPVTDVTVRGLHFTCTTVPLVSGGFAADAFAGAIDLDHSHRGRLEQVVVSLVAGQGIKGTANVVEMVIEHCEIAHTGAGGIYVGGQRAQIRDNHVHHVGRMFPSAIGIYRHASDSIVAHNEVHDTPYSAIAYPGERNVLEYNLLYRCMLELHDGGAIYMGGKECVLRGNVARDIPDTGGWGSSSYYLDEESTGFVVEGNLSLNVGRPSHNHMAVGNIIRNNLFVQEGDMRLTFPRSVNHEMHGNLLYASGLIRVEASPRGVIAWLGNRVFSVSGQYEQAVLGAAHDVLRVEEPNWGDTVFEPIDPAEIAQRRQAIESLAGRRPYHHGTR